MPRPRRSAALGLILLVGHAMALPAMASEDHVFYHENVLGTSLELVVDADTAATACRVEERILAEIDRLAKIFSSYDRASEWSRWQCAARRPCKVSAELFDVLTASDRWSARSGGAFDPRIEVFSRLWERCVRSGRLPTDQETAAAKSMLIDPAWRLDSHALTAERLSDCPVSLNGIAKGSIVETAADSALASTSGVKGLLLNVGGDLRVRGEAPRTIGIVAPWADSESADPLVNVSVKNQSVATSGMSRRGFDIKGKWYSHVFDPRTGRPVERVMGATVVASRGADADALAKICSLLEPGQSLSLIKTMPGVECLIVLADRHIVKSPGWNRLERVDSIMLAQASTRPGGTTAKAEPEAKAGPAWNSEFELVVNFEINQPGAEKGRYRRPYVAVWAEDSQGRSVRTLALWVSLAGSGPFQWLPDLKRWFKSDEERKLAGKKDIFFAISRPTRPPSKYKLIWDGKDDDGKPLAAGDYTVFIEAAREHGTYQSIRQQVSLTDKPFREDLKGNVEIRSASIEYRRKAAPK